MFRYRYYGVLVDVSEERSVLVHANRHRHKNRRVISLLPTVAILNFTPQVPDPFLLYSSLSPLAANLS
jgi:hypothetical protein